MTFKNIIILWNLILVPTTLNFNLISVFILLSKYLFIL